MVYAWTSDSWRIGCRPAVSGSRAEDAVARRAIGANEYGNHCCHDYCNRDMDAARSGATGFGCNRIWAAGLRLGFRAGHGGGRQMRPAISFTLAAPTEAF